MNIYVQLEKNVNQYSFFPYILLIPARRRGAYSQHPPAKSGRSQGGKSLDAPGHSSEAGNIYKDLELQEAGPKSGSCLKTASQQTASQEQTQMLFLLVSAYFARRLTFQTLESVATWLPACRARLTGSHTCRQAPPMSSSELTGDLKKHA